MARRNQCHPGPRPVLYRLTRAGDLNRAAALADIEARIYAIAATRGVRASIAKSHEANAFVCDATLSLACAGGRSRWRSAPALAFGRGSRHDGHGQALSRGHALRSVQGRREPQSAGIDHRRGLRNRIEGAYPIHSRFSRRLELLEWRRRDGSSALRRRLSLSPNRAISIGCGAISESRPGVPISLTGSSRRRFDSDKNTVARNSEKVKILAHDSDGLDNSGRSPAVSPQRRRSASPDDRGHLLSGSHNSALHR